MKGRALIIGILAAALFQTGALAKMIVDRARLLQNGAEVVLETGMVDPRDLFRGHYVRLDLTIQRIDLTTLPPFDRPKGLGPIYLELAPGEDGYWVPVAAHASLPETDRPVLRGRFVRVQGKQLIVDLPFDRYFAPRDRARELEGIRNDRALGLIVALAPDGTGAVKGITIAGEKHYIEPLY